MAVSKIKAGVLGAAAASILAVNAGPPPAAAVLREVRHRLDGGWFSFGRAYKDAAGNGMDHWDRFRIGEIRSPVSTWFDQICDYQAEIKWVSPQGRVVHTQRSPFKNGCSFLAWMDFPNYDSNYARGTKFPTKWKSNHTRNNGVSGAWEGVGTLT